VIFRLLGGTLLVATLALSAVAQNKGQPGPPAFSKITAHLAGDAPHIIAILATQPREPLGPSDILKNYEQGMTFISQRTYVELAQIAVAARRGQISRDEAEYLTQESFQLGIIQFQLLNTLHQILEHDIAKAAQQLQMQPSDVLVTPTFSSLDMWEGEPNSYPAPRVVEKSAYR
jgi:hypothetical protein